jgi:hypothetical protein
MELKKGTSQSLDSGMVEATKGYKQGGGTIRLTLFLLPFWPFLYIL